MDTRCESVSVTGVLLRLSRSGLMGLPLTSVLVVSSINFSFLDPCWPPSCLLSGTSLIIYDAHVHSDIIGKLPSRSFLVAECLLLGGILYLVMAVR